MLDYEHWSLGTKMVVIICIYCIVNAVFWLFAILSDIRWHKKHPGANDYLAKLDDELSKNEQ